MATATGKSSLAAISEIFSECGPRRVPWILAGALARDGRQFIWPYNCRLLVQEGTENDRGLAHGTDPTIMPGFQFHTQRLPRLVSVCLFSFAMGAPIQGLTCLVLVDAERPSSGAEQSNPMWKVLGISRWNYWGLVCLNYLGISAVCAANALSRFYFAHGGSRRWISSWLQSVGFPILFVPLIACYRRQQALRPFKSLSPKTALVCCGMGVLLGVDNLMFAWGISYLSVSTYSLLSSSQLAFNSVFAFLVVRQRFGSSTVNCVVLLTLSSVLVGFSSDHERAEGVSRGNYATGILTTIGAAAVYGLILPLMELIYMKMKCRMTYVVVLEMQVVMSATATVFSTVGMWVNGDFGGMHREARQDFDVGQMKYYMTILWTAVSWQLFFVGTAGMIFLTTSLVSGILMTALLPASLITAVIFFHDNFNGEKGVAMMLSLWGFASYLYGEHRNQRQPQQAKPCEGESELNNQAKPCEVDDSIPGNL